MGVDKNSTLLYGSRQVLSTWETSIGEQTCIWKTNIWKQTRVVHFYTGADRRLSVLVVVCHIGLLPFSVLPCA